MTTLHTLPGIMNKKKKRLGRGLGSGAGAKSGRGTTRHQKARRSIPLHFEGGQNRAVKKYPLLRGKEKNKSVHIKPLAVSIAKISSFEATSTVSIETLIEKRIIHSSMKQRGVKIVSDGNLTVQRK